MILYEIIAFVLPGLTRSVRRFLGPIVIGSSVLFYTGIVFSYFVLTPAALNFFVNYAEGVVESLWSINQYFEFVLVLMFSTGLSFQVTIILSSVYFFLHGAYGYYSYSLTALPSLFNTDTGFSTIHRTTHCNFYMLQPLCLTSLKTHIYLF